MPRQDVTEERINQIIEAAVAVFAREGFAQARMDDIAKEARLSKGALYLYFKSKDAIIASILKFFFRQEMRLLNDYPITDAPIGDQIVQLALQLAGGMERMKPFMPIAFEFYAIAGRQRDVRQFLIGYFADYRAFFAKWVQQGIDRGEFRAEDPISVATSIIALFEGLALLWIVDPQGMSWKDQAEAAMRLLIYGLQARSPTELTT